MSVAIALIITILVIVILGVGIWWVWYMLFIKRSVVLIANNVLNTPLVYDINSNEVHIHAQLDAFGGVDNLSIQDFLNLIISKDKQELINFLNNNIQNKAHFKPVTFDIQLLSQKTKRYFHYSLKITSHVDNQIYMVLKSMLLSDVVSEKEKAQWDIEIRSKSYLEKVKSYFEKTNSSSLNACCIISIDNFDDVLTDYDSNYVKILVQRIYIHLKKSLSSNTVIHWMGGTMFMISMINIRHSKLNLELKKIERAFKKPVKISNLPFFVNYSIATATLEGKMNIMKLQELEIKTIYCAKIMKDQKLKSYSFTHGDNEKYIHFLSLITFFKQTIDARSFDQFFMPIVEINKKERNIDIKIIGYSSINAVSYEDKIVNISDAYSLSKFFGNYNYFFEKIFMTTVKKYFSMLDKNKAALFIDCPLSGVYIIGDLIDKLKKEIKNFDHNLIVLNIINWEQYLFDEIQDACKELYKFDILYGFKNSVGENKFFKLLVLEPNVIFIDNKFIDNLHKNEKHAFRIKTIVKILSTTGGIAVAPAITDVLQLESLFEIGVKGLGGPFIADASRELVDKFPKLENIDNLLRWK